MRANQQSQRLDPRTYLFFALWVGCASCIYPTITVSDFAHLCPISFAQTFPKLVYEFCIRIVTGPIAVVVSLLFYCPIVIVIAMAILSYDSDLLSLPLPPLILYPYSPRSAIPPPFYLCDPVYFRPALVLSVLNLYPLYFYYLRVFL